MKKLFLLFCLVVSIGVVAQTKTTFKYSISEVQKPTTTLKVDKTKKYTSLKDVKTLNWEERIVAMNEIVQSGLAYDNPKEEKSESRIVCDKLESVISTYADGTNYSGQFITYDGNFRPTKIQSCMWESDAWVTYEDAIYEWDDEDRLTMFQSYQPVWGEGMRQEYVYNTLGQLITYTTTAYFEGDWMLMNKYEYAYDDTGNANEIISYYYSGDWQYESKETAEYDDFKRQIIYESYYYAGGWQKSVRELYEYDDDDHQTSFIIQLDGGSDWINDMRYEHEYENGLIMLQKVSFWNTSLNNWNGHGDDFGTSEKTVFAYDDQSREISQVVSKIFTPSTGEYTDKGAIYTTWSTLPNDETESVALAYDEDIYGWDEPFRTVTTRYNAMGLITYFGEIQPTWEINRWEETVYDANGNELEITSWYLNEGTTYSDMRLVFEYENNNPVLQTNYFSDGGQGWEPVSQFIYEYENNYRTRHLFFSYDGSDFMPSWGWGIDLDFNVLAVDIIQPSQVTKFQDRLYDHKITYTYDYQSAGSDWNIITFTRNYVDQEIGIEENKFAEHAVYPNPAQNYVIVESENVINSIYVYDITGRSVINITNVNDFKMNIDISMFNTGVYIMNVDSKMYKVIKK